MGKDATDSPYKIVPINEENGTNNITPEEKENAIDAGHTTDGKNVSIMIENALLVMAIRDGVFHISRLDTLIASCLNEKGKVISSNIKLQNLRDDKILDKVDRKHVLSNSSFFVKTYTAERKIEIPSNTYLIKAEYKIKQPGYLQKMSIATIFSLIASIVTISVLFYLLLILRRKHQEVSNMERSFHGAIHDLKSPLAFVYFTLSALEEKETDMTKKTALIVMGDRTNYLTNKIMRLLKSGQNLQKISEDEKQNVFLCDELEQIEVEIKTMFPGKAIEFENDVVPDLYLCGIPDLLEAVLRILIENAVKYNSNHPFVKIKATRDENNVKIEVIDNGIGMSKQQIKHLFKPYYTSDNKNGTGIGLYYAKRIIIAHGGRISADSTPGKGSTFTINFPQKNNI